MTQIVQEGIEPLLVGTSLLQLIEQPDMWTVFTIMPERRRSRRRNGSPDLQHQHRRSTKLRRDGQETRLAFEDRREIGGRDLVLSSCPNKNPSRARESLAPTFDLAAQRSHVDPCATNFFSALRTPVFVYLKVRKQPRSTRRRPKSITCITFTVKLRGNAIPPVEHRDLSTRKQVSVGEISRLSIEPRPLYLRFDRFRPRMGSEKRISSLAESKESGSVAHPLATSSPASQMRDRE
jgi:hypothetical protein